MDQEKGKRKYTIMYFLKPILVSLMIIFSCPFLLFVYLMIRGDQLHRSFGPENVEQTCKVLALSAESDFCKSIGPQNSQVFETLKDALEYSYPPGSTTLEEFLQALPSDMECLKFRNGYCSIKLPIGQATLFSRYDGYEGEEQIIQSYYVGNGESD